MNIAQPGLKTLPKYFFLLDIIRGLAALSVVMYHWEKFYTTENEALATFNHSHQPLYSVFYLFYNSGDVAVDLFFLISGFVFFYLYSKNIAEGNISSRSFFILRFSRLYPLHAATLLFVLAAQLLIYSDIGTYLVYAYNDAYHFILNIFLANSWGLEKAASFNGPNWSVSVEVLLYLLFFILCVCRLNKKFVLLLLVLAGIVLQSFYSPLGRGLFSFFLGGLLYYLYLYIVKQGKAAVYLRVIGIIALSFSLLMVLNAKYGFLDAYAMDYLKSRHMEHRTTFFVTKTFNFFVRAVILPSLILFTVLLETVKGPVGKKFAFIGHISYSSYLLHFPLQLILIYCSEKWGIDKYSVFNSPYALAGFFVVLIIISLTCYNYFELPMQTYLRKRLLKKQGTTRL